MKDIIFTVNRIVVIITVVFILQACAHNPYSATNKIYRKQADSLAKELRRQPAAVSPAGAPFWAGAVNFDLRKPDFVIIHHTAQNSCEQTLKTFTTPRSKVSAHYVICKDGTVHHMLSDYLRAWQAGKSKWGNNTDINSSSIGIEIDNNGFEGYTSGQIMSLLQLLERLKTAYGIPDANFIGHSDIAPGRKVDPGNNFPWQLLAEKKFGMWYDTTNVVAGPGFNAMQALRIIGYNTKDSTSAIRSFKLHFKQGDSTTRLTDTDKKILADLVKKY